MNDTIYISELEALPHILKPYGSLTVTVERRRYSDLSQENKAKATILYDGDRIPFESHAYFIVPHGDATLENAGLADEQNSQLFIVLVSIDIKGTDEEFVETLNRVLSTSCFELPLKSLMSGSVELQIELLTEPPEHRNHNVFRGSASTVLPTEIKGALNKEYVWASALAKGVSATESYDDCASWFRVTLHDGNYREPLWTYINEHRRDLSGRAIEILGAGSCLFCLFAFGNDPRLFFMGLSMAGAGAGGFVKSNVSALEAILSLVGILSGAVLMSLGCAISAPEGGIAVIFDPRSGKIVEVKENNNRTGRSMNDEIIFHRPDFYANSFYRNWKFDCRFPSGDTGTSQVVFSAYFSFQDIPSLVKNYPRGLYPNYEGHEQFSKSVCKSLPVGNFGLQMSGAEVNSMVTTLVQTAITNTGVGLAEGNVSVQSLSVCYTQDCGVEVDRFNQTPTTIIP